MSEATKKPVILVIGDAMIDEIVFHYDYRRTPDGVVVLPSVVCRSAEPYRVKAPGGAAAVARMVNGLGGVAYLGCVVGQDYPREGDFHCRGSYIRTSGRSTRKTRHIVDNKTIFRRDREWVGDSLSFGQVESLCQGLKDSLRLREDRPDAIILSDYGKGVLGRPETPRQIVKHFPGIPVFVDPLAGRDWSEYGKCEAIFPNAHELGQRLPRDAMRTACASVLVRKRGASGLWIYEGDNPPVPCSYTLHPQCVVDTVGAGDMAIAAFAVETACGKCSVEAGRFAAAAATEKCTLWGAVPVSREAVEERRYGKCLS